MRFELTTSWTWVSSQRFVVYLSNGDWKMFFAVGIRTHDLLEDRISSRSWLFTIPEACRRLRYIRLRRTRLCSRSIRRTVSPRERRGRCRTCDRCSRSYGSLERKESEKWNTDAHKMIKFRERTERDNWHIVAHAMIKIQRQKERKTDRKKERKKE